MEKTIYDLKLHERMHIDHSFYVRRVPNGWIYTDYYNEHGVFVPYNEEFNLGHKTKQDYKNPNEIIHDCTRDYYLKLARIEEIKLSISAFENELKILRDGPLKSSEENRISCMNVIYKRIAKLTEELRLLKKEVK